MSPTTQSIVIIASILFTLPALTLNAAPAYWDSLPLEEHAQKPQTANTVAFSQNTKRTERFFGDSKTPPRHEPRTYDYRTAAPVIKTDFSAYRKVNVNIPEHMLIRSQDTFDGLSYQAEYLRKNKRNPYLKDKGLPLDHIQLVETITALQTWLADDHPLPLNTQFDLYQLEEKDNPGHVRFTGYYSEILAAKRKPDTTYRYPVYGLPDYIKPLPSRDEINRGALKGKNLEIGWVKDRIDLYFMQIQGSGYLQFDDDSTQLVSFAAKNKYPYSSIGRYMSDRGYLPSGKITNELVRRWLEKHPHRIDEMLNTNPSYVFFKRSYGSVMTAARVPATTGHTVSVDTDYIPFGSVLLAKVPLKDTEGKLKGYDWRLLFPQDRGTAVEGPGHVDLYMGAGPEARKKSDSLSLYGTVYVLLKKP